MTTMVKKQTSKYLSVGGEAIFNFRIYRVFFRILKKVELLTPYLETSEEKMLFLVALKAFKSVNDLVFGSKLGEGWREALNDLKTALSKLHTSSASLPITPKFHVLMEHVETWVDRNQDSLGSFSEQALEALHHLFKQVWENYKVKDETSKAYQHSLLQAGLKFNSDNI